MGGGGGGDGRREGTNNLKRMIQHNKHAVSGSRYFNFSQILCALGQSLVKCLKQSGVRLHSSMQT